MEDLDKKEVEELRQSLDEISTKLDEISKSSVYTEEENKAIAKLKERIKNISNYLEEARKGAVETKLDIENKIKESPLICLGATFIGGLIIGRLTKR